MVFIFVSVLRGWLWTKACVKDRITEGCNLKVSNSHWTGYRSFTWSKMQQCLICPDKTSLLTFLRFQVSFNYSFSSSCYFNGRERRKDFSIFFICTFTKSFKEKWKKRYIAAYSEMAKYAACSNKNFHTFHLSVFRYDPILLMLLTFSSSLLHVYYS